MICEDIISSEHNLFTSISNEHKLSVTLDALLMKINNGEELRKELSKTINIDLSTDNDELYHKYIDAKIDSIMVEKSNQQLIPYIKSNVIDIGEGSFGSVYKVKHNIDDSYYAIKKVPIFLDDFGDPTKIANEVKILASMTYHPNIVRYYHSWLDNKNMMICDDDSDVEKADAYLYIQMELCDSTLREYMSLDIYNDDSTERLYLWSNICNGVKHLHDHNIIHRDIKPSNIFLKNGLVKLGDFGLSKLYDNETSFKDQSIEIGCSYYRAPEIDSGIYNSSIDIYSIGIILIELLLNYSTIHEKHLIIRKMLNDHMIPDLLTNQYNSLIKTMISHDCIERPTIYDIKI